MKNLVKFFLSTVLIFCFSSCAQVGSSGEGQIVISADNIIRSVARAGGETGSFDLKVSITGGYRKELSISGLTNKDLGTDKTNIYIDKIPAMAVINISIRLYEGDELKYEGNRDGFRIRAGDNQISIALHEPIIPAWYVLWQKYNPNDDTGKLMAEHPMPKFAIYDHAPTGNENYSDGIYSSNKLLIDFCFDKNNNLYTIEADANYVGSQWEYNSYSINKYRLNSSGMSPITLFTYTVPSQKEKKLYTSIGTDGTNLYIGGVTDTVGFGVYCISCNGTVSSLGNSVISVVTEPTAIEVSNDSLYIAYYDSSTSYVNVISKYNKTSYHFNQTFNFNGYTINDLQLNNNFLFAISNNGILYKINPSPFDSEILINEEINTEENPSHDYFYRPAKFIALKPKELVIADDGFYDTTNKDSVVIIKLSNPKKFASRKNMANINFDGIIASGFID